MPTHPMIEMTLIKIDHEVVGVGGSIPLDDFFVEKEAGGADYAHPYDRNDPYDLGGSRGCGGGGFNAPSRFVCHRRRHKK